MGLTRMESWLSNEVMFGLWRQTYFLFYFAKKPRKNMLSKLQPFFLLNFDGAMSGYILKAICHPSDLSECFILKIIVKKLGGTMVFWIFLKNILIFLLSKKVISEQCVMLFLQLDLNYLIVHITTGYNRSCVNKK